jgi:PAS domain S-box-containing protein
MPLTPPRAPAGGPQVRPGAWDPWLARAGGALVGALWALGYAPGGDPARAARIVQAAMLPLALVFGVLLWRAAWAAESRGDAPSARAWRHVAAAACAWWMAGALWELLGRPPVSAADVVQLAFFPFVLAGVLAFPTPPAPRGFRVRFWLDAGVVVLSGAAVVWYWVLWPALTTRGAVWVDVLVNALYPVADLAVVFAACAALVRGPDARGAARAGLGGGGAAGALRRRRELRQGDADRRLRRRRADRPDLADGRLGAGHRRRGLGAAGGGAAPRAGADGARRVGRARAAPLRAVVTLHGFLLFGPAGAWGTRGTGVLAIAVAVTALVLLRQWVASRELARLQGERGARAAVRASEARFRSLVQHSSDIIALLDAGGTVRYVSPSIERNLGHQAGPLLGTQIREHVHPDDVALSEVVLAEAARTEGTYGPVVLRLVTTAGEWRTMECLAPTCWTTPRWAGSSSTCAT